MAIRGPKDDGAGRLDREPFLSAAARIRAPSEDFVASFRELQGAVDQACDEHFEWEPKVAAAIRAGLAFAAAKPARAYALTIGARRPAAPIGSREEDVVAHFAALLRAKAPSPPRYPAAHEEGLIDSIATVVRGNLLAGTADQLTALAPDLVYLTLMPYAGIEGARRWARALELG